MVAHPRCSIGRSGDRPASPRSGTAVARAQGARGHWHQDGAGRSTALSVGSRWRSRSRSLTVALLAWCCSVSAWSVHAQQTPPPRDSVRMPPRDSMRVGQRSTPELRTPVSCSGQTVSNVVVITNPPYTDRLPPSLEFARETMLLLHQNTRDDVIRRYLLLEAGDICTEFARTESERILRVQPYIVDARVRAFEEDDGTVELEVETRDEFSLFAEAQVRGVAPLIRGVMVGERNLMGRALSATLLWRHGGAYNDAIGAQIVDYQFLGRRTLANFAGVRTERGHNVLIDISRPYFTDLQRVAWRAGYGNTRDYQRLLRANDRGTGLAVQQEFADIGGLIRVGPPGRLQLVGVSLSRERDRIGTRPLLIERDGFQPDSLGDDFVERYANAYREKDVVRANLLLGVRRLSFLRVEGFDALTGVQDMRLGVQGTVSIGRALPLPGIPDRDLFVRHSLYAGGGTPRSFGAVETVTEARRGDQTPSASGAWDGVLTSGHAAWYYKPWTNQLTLTQLDWSAGWNVRVPYQLSFADPNGGMLGYARSRLAGARRAVLRVEQRWLPTPRTAVGDVGFAFFGELGKLWAGDVPYAATSPVRGTVGVGVLAAVPRRSRRLWRLDVGVPVGGDPNARFEVRISSLDRTRFFWQEPLDLARSRERAVPGSLFNWP